MNDKSGSRQRRLEKLQRENEALKRKVDLLTPIHTLPEPEFQARIAELKAQNPLLGIIVEASSIMIRRAMEREPDEEPEE